MKSTNRFPLPKDIRLSILDFIKSPPDQWIIPKSTWIYSDHYDLKVYLRRGPRKINNQLVKAVTIANISVDVQRQGIGMGLINYIHFINPSNHTYVECVNNPHLACWLERNGWVKEDSLHYLDVNYFKQKSTTGCIMLDIEELSDIVCLSKDELRCIHQWAIRPYRELNKKLLNQINNLLGLAKRNDSVPRELGAGLDELRVQISGVE